MTIAGADLKLIEMKGAKVRVLLAAAILFALVFGWISVRRQFGDMLAELTATNDPNAAAAAEIAGNMAPSDPLPMWLKATVAKNDFNLERSRSSIGLFEATVRLAPADFRWWIELGRSYEQADLPEKAEAAMKRAIELAPFYTFPRWQLGNFYLRQGRSDEAFAELRKATENNQLYREQVFSLAWDYFGKDTAQLEKVIADKPDVYASLALFYGARGQAADSLRIWNRLGDEDKAAHPQFLSVIAQGLYEKRYFPEALEFAKQLGMDPDAQPETITNGGFERGLGDEKETRFGWKVTRNDSKLDISADATVHREGSRSLKLNFRSYAKPELYNVLQTVVVQPGKNYRLKFWLRTENLRSAGAPQLQILNANDDKLITNSAAYPTGTNDWQEITVEFTAPENCNGVNIRTVRGFCGDNCPIVGMLWYDGFELKRL